MIQLIIEEIDPETNCVASRAPLEVADVSDIESCIDIDFEEDKDVIYRYDLSNEDLIALADKFELADLGRNGFGRIRRKVKFDDLPYQVHTGRELLLMLRGDKPMSFFSYRSDDRSGIKEDIDASFYPYIRDKKIVKFEHKMIQKRNDESTFEIEYLIYTLPSETWRANALIVLKEAGARSGWSEGMERMEGVLLGYSDRENDIFIERVFRRP
jgi:hypothetical protein